MTNKIEKLLSLDVVYSVFSLILLMCYFEGENFYSLLFLFVTTIYYIRIKIYRWKKYHQCGIFILEVFYVY